MNVLSLFDGIATARQALKNLNIKVDNYFASEIDKYALQISKYNFPDIIQLGDVRNIGHGTIARLQNKMICEIDLMIGGFPCTNLSIAKKNREGLAGSESGLFYEMIRIHKEVKPTFFIYENVFSMAKDQKDIITQTIGELMQCPCGCEEWGILDRCL
mgnify:CR=1 FL=1